MPAPRLIKLKHSIHFYYNYVLYESDLPDRERILLHWLINKDFESDGRRKGFV